MAGNKDIPQVKNPPQGDGHHVTYRVMSATELAERDARQAAYDAMLARQEAFESGRQRQPIRRRPRRRHRTDLGPSEEKMHLCISGFLIDDSKDDSLKFELDVAKDHERAVMEVMNWRSFEEGAVGEVPLSKAKIQKIEALLNKTLPHELALYIGVET